MFEMLSQLFAAMPRLALRTTALLTAAIAAALVLGGTSAPARAQVGFDRPGGDYFSLHIRSGDPADCAARCERENRCRAWSFAYPGTTGSRAMCWLKSSVPHRVENGCCVSGVRGAGVVESRSGGAATHEFGIDRFGGDYRAFDVAPDANGTVCATACAGDSRCRAWTYSRPGYGTGQARCYLKSRVTLPRPRPCCISGVVR